MKAKIDMIGIITSNFSDMKKFYSNVMGFKVIMEMDEYVEFENEGVRFAISTSNVMHMATKDESYNEKRSGQSLELAFRAKTPSEVDNEFEKLVENGAREVMKPEDMPWNQRAAFFADPDGNIHEIFCDLKQD